MLIYTFFIVKDNEVVAGPFWTYTEAKKALKKEDEDAVIIDGTLQFTAHNEYT